MDRAKNVETIWQDFRRVKQSILPKSPRIAEKDLSPLQGVVLLIISREPRLGIKDLADKLFVSPSAVTQCINTLVKKKYVERLEASEDRRGIELRLAAAGKTPLHKFQAENLNNLHRIFAALTDRELVEYARLTRKIADHLQDQ